MTAVPPQPAPRTQMTKWLSHWFCIATGCGRIQRDVEKPALTCCDDPQLLRIGVRVPEPEWRRLRRERERRAS